MPVRRFAERLRTDRDHRGERIEGGSAGYGVEETVSLPVVTALAMSPASAGRIRARQFAVARW